MKTLKQLIAEEKNVHMEHVEDLVFNGGVDGTRTAINFLRDLRDMLAGNAKQSSQATVKWDGAPAIFAGIDPRDGKFFVAKKGVFNKTPKVYKTPQEVDADTSGDLADKLKLALAELSKLNIKSGIYQGDFLFSNADLKTETIDGQKYTTFHPNTIVYAVPYDSSLAYTIRRAKIGIVWHTMYTGDSFETMKGSFGKPIARLLGSSSSVWMEDATYKDYSGTATFTKEETEAVTAMLANVGRLFQTIDAKTLNAISADPDLLADIKTYNNSKVRAGEKVTNISAHVRGLFQWIYDKYEKEIGEKKTPKGKSAVEQKRKKILAWFANHDQQEIVKIFQVSNMIADIKQPIIAKMNQAGHIPTFVKTSSGFRATGVEGFVAIDYLKGGAVKLVDRMEFSRNNFDPTILKGWQR